MTTPRDFIGGGGILGTGILPTNLIDQLGPVASKGLSINNVSTQPTLDVNLDEVTLTTTNNVINATGVLPVNANNRNLDLQGPNPILQFNNVAGTPTAPARMSVGTTGDLTINTSVSTGITVKNQATNAAVVVGADNLATPLQGCLSVRNSRTSPTSSDNVTLTVDSGVAPEGDMIRCIKRYSPGFSMVIASLADTTNPFTQRHVSFNQVTGGNIGATVGTIQSTNGNTQYNSVSDHRLKENIINATPDVYNKIMAARVVHYNMVGFPQAPMVGFLAHELKEVIPEQVTGEKDEVDAYGNPVYQQVNLMGLVPYLVYTVQVLHNRVNALETQIQTLLTPQ